VFELGRHFEWMWLLNQCRIAGFAVPGRLKALGKTSFTSGFSPQTGLPYAAVLADGTVADANCRLWTITEWLRVCTVASPRSPPVRSRTCNGFWARAVRACEPNAGMQGRSVFWKRTC